MPNSSTPRVTQEARAEAASLARRFKETLQSVAENLAANDGSESVTVSHNHRAHRALLTSDDVARPYYKRPQFLQNLGAFVAPLGFTFATVAYSALGFTGGIPKDRLLPFLIWVVAIPVAIVVAGVALFLCGLFRT